MELNAKTTLYVGESSPVPRPHSGAPTLWFGAGDVSPAASIRAVSFSRARAPLTFAGCIFPPPPSARAGGLAEQVNEEVLYSTFIPFGEIVSVQIPPDPSSSGCFKPPNPRRGLRFPPSPGLSKARASSDSPCRRRGPRLAAPCAGGGSRAILFTSISCRKPAQGFRLCGVRAVGRRKSRDRQQAPQRTLRLVRRRVAAEVRDTERPGRRRRFRAGSGGTGRGRPGRGRSETWRAGPGGSSHRGFISAANATSNDARLVARCSSPVCRTGAYGNPSGPGFYCYSQLPVIPPACDAAKRVRSLPAAAYEDPALTRLSPSHSRSIVARLIDVTR
ncbi:MAG: hypothetical protein BJ554DRAFT_4736 [Olpidium bornovanus]|uniref:Uncharacterized protein n=1 Tax=Olpidium bornovanus TaxID=278681 RepID=A0A8H7ZM64_9FUNG|nr:MAG: hypothetical protein BJ554DRAFT_4736 [Olpidium bornovanus]